MPCALMFLVVLLGLAFDGNTPVSLSPCTQSIVKATKALRFYVSRLLSHGMPCFSKREVKSGGSFAVLADKAGG